MRTPTIHLNGTAERDLVDGLCEAIHAIRLAERAVQKAAPNGRDYYPQGAAAINEALAEHSARLRKLREVAHELETIVASIGG